jgi:hypothetical protein
MTACASVLTTNPFLCQEIDTVEFGNATKIFRVWKKWNNILQQVNNFEETPLLHSFTLHVSIGQANLLIGHIGVRASYAAQAMNDSSRLSKRRTEGTFPMIYGVDYTVDVSLQFRNLTLHFHDDSPKSGTFTSTRHAMKDSCQLGITFSLEQLATTALMAPYQIMLLTALSSGRDTRCNARPLLFLAPQFC